MPGWGDFLESALSSYDREQERRTRNKLSDAEERRKDAMEGRYNSAEERAQAQERQRVLDTTYEAMQRPILEQRATTLFDSQAEMARLAIAKAKQDSLRAVTEDEKAVLALQMSQQEAAWMQLHGDEQHPQAPGWTWWQLARTEPGTVNAILDHQARMAGAYNSDYKGPNDSGPQDPWAPPRPYTDTPWAGQPEQSWRDPYRLDTLMGNVDKGVKAKAGESLNIMKSVPGGITDLTPEGIARQQASAERTAYPQVFPGVLQRAAAAAGSLPDVPMGPPEAGYSQPSGEKSWALGNVNKFADQSAGQLIQLGDASSGQDKIAMGEALRQAIAPNMQEWFSRYGPPSGSVPGMSAQDVLTRLVGVAQVGQNPPGGSEGWTDETWPQRQGFAADSTYQADIHGRPGYGEGQNLPGSYRAKGKGKKKSKAQNKPKMSLQEYRLSRGLP